MTRRTVTFAGSALAIETTGVLAERIVDLLFARVARIPVATAVADRSADSMHTLALVADASDAPGELSCDGAPVFRSAHAGLLAEHTQTTAAYHLIDGCRDGLVVHAGALSCDDRAVLLPAQSGSGKSTLTAWLTSRGFVHHSDELAHLREPDGPIEGYRRPIELKAGGRVLIEPLVERHRAPDAWLDTLGGCMLDPSLLGASASHGRLTALVFPTYAGAGAPLALQSLSPAAASSRLLRCTLNARNLAGHGLPAAARWARALPAFALQYGSFEGVEAALRGVLAAS